VPFDCQEPCVGAPRQQGDEERYADRDREH
jgi:hypothetical protein